MWWYNSTVHAVSAAIFPSQELVVWLLWILLQPSNCSWNLSQAVDKLSKPGKPGSHYVTDMLYLFLLLSRIIVRGVILFPSYAVLRRGLVGFLVTGVDVVFESDARSRILNFSVLSVKRGVSTILRKRHSEIWKRNKNKWKRGKPIKTPTFSLPIVPFHPLWSFQGGLIWILHTLNKIILASKGIRELTSFVFLNFILLIQIGIAIRR